jgi:hypothetical protein
MESVLVKTAEKPQKRYFITAGRPIQDKNIQFKSRCPFTTQGLVWSGRYGRSTESKFRGFSFLVEENLS